MLINKEQNKLKIVVSVAIIILIIAGVATYYTKFYKEDLNKSLPITTVSESKNLEDIAYKFWFTYMNSYTGNNVSSWKRINDVRYNKFQLLAGDENEFAIAVTFWVQLEKKNWSTHNNWGYVQEDGSIKDIQWTLRIKKTGENKYTLVRIEDTSNAVSGLAPVEDKYQKDAGIKVPNENNRYEIVNNHLKVTYDNGEHWNEVPVSLEDLFRGEYNGSKKYLIDGSYVITPQKTAFVTGGDYNLGDNDLRIIQSNDKGKTWNTSSIKSPFPAIRMRLLGFTSDENGYLILSGDRTMSSEAHAVFKTNDGGKTWVNTGNVKENYRLITSGGFINDELGFISFGAINVNDELPRPSLYRSADKGETWNEVNVPIPKEYKGIFTVAEVPTFDGSQGTLLVNQGPSGDYQGGKVLARFISLDEGATWSFANLVDPDNVIDN